MTRHQGLTAGSASSLSGSLMWCWGGLNSGRLGDNQKLLRLCPSLLRRCRLCPFRHLRMWTWTVLPLITSQRLLRRTSGYSVFRTKVSLQTIQTINFRALRDAQRAAVPSTAAVGAPDSESCHSDSTFGKRKQLSVAASEFRSKREPQRRAHASCS